MELWKIIEWKRLEDILVGKIIDFTHYILSKLITIVYKVGELTVDEIEKLKKREIEVIIIYVDDTLRKEIKSIPWCNKEWIEGLEGRF